MDAAGNPSPKAEWNVDDIEWVIFENKTYNLLGNAKPKTKLSDGRANFRFTIFPAGFDFTKYNNLLHVDFYAAIFGDNVAFNDLEFGDDASFIRARFVGRSNFHGVEFGDNTNFSNAQLGEATNFSEAKFGKFANFSNATILKSTNFNNVTFGSYADFTSMSLRKEADFSDAKFAEHANFSNARIENSSIFINTKFGNSSNFTNMMIGKSADFSGAIFGNDVNFNSSNFGELSNFKGAKFGTSVNITGATFGKSANFTGATFGASANFKDAKFQDFAIFTKATFGGGANFNGAEFGDMANFGNSKFGRLTNFEDANFVKRGLFVDARFLGDVSFSVGEANKRRLVFRRINFSKVKFFGPCSFENRVFTSETLFDETEFHDLANFHGCGFHQGMTFQSEQFLKTKGTNDTETTELESAYRTLRLGMENLRARNEEAMFFAKEMECHRRRRFFSFDWVVSALYNILSGYGRSIIRPLMWLLGLTALSFGLYAWAFYYGAEAFPEGPFKYGREIFEFTVEQIFRPFGIWSLSAGEKSTYDAVRVFLKEYHRPLIPILASLQSLATIGLLTLFLLALRRRFKMD